jgi:excisionase family DNA binding protein
VGSSNLLTLSEAAKELRLSKTTMLRLIAGSIPNQSALPAVRFGRRVLIRRESLERFIALAEDGVNSTP